jgi:hypothetical protein
MLHQDEFRCWRYRRNLLPRLPNADRPIASCASILAEDVAMNAPGSQRYTYRRETCSKAHSKPKCQDTGNHRHISSRWG